jgi:DNA invertase Pin-like site-specific DNA recombinase
MVYHFTIKGLAEFSGVDVITNLQWLDEMELENIKERILVGRQVYVQRGGIPGRPSMLLWLKLNKI